jgi:histidine triad (HIT) family protein
MIELTANDCVFCRIIRREIPAVIIDEDDATIVFLSLENHPLVVTRKHVPDVLSLDDELASQVMRETVRIARAVKDGLRCDGIRLSQANGAAAGQDVFHFHMHVYPCWENRPDRNVWSSGSISHERRDQIAGKIKESLAGSD